MYSKYNYYNKPYISEAAKEQITLDHPLSKDLAFLYGTIITDGKDQITDGATKNLCVFADKEVRFFIYVSEDNYILLLLFKFLC